MTLDLLGVDRLSFARFQMANLRKEIIPVLGVDFVIDTILVGDDSMRITMKQVRHVPLLPAPEGDLFDPKG